MLAGIQLAPGQCAPGPQNKGILWSKLPAPIAAPVNQEIPGSISDFGIRVIDSSWRWVDDRLFTVPLLWALEDIYANRPNQSEIVKSYAYKDVLTFDAVGEGLNETQPTAFNTRALVLFIRWAGQVLSARKETTFECHFGFDFGKPSQRQFLVATAKYATVPYI
ncbi:MAG: hypothetical protein Q9169_002811 [Polycauliona sp. 2 TL-2023]